jgi:peptidoglycan/xylan/chitin deacetylase (PgdA/CDA1 family)
MQPPTAIMFHSVGLDRFDWVYPHIAEPPGFFANRMAALARAGYSTAFFATGHERSDGKVIVLTFDDGYLDN